MGRPNTQLTEAVNSDSFLDIVASVVSIMIIMVVMEGMRIKNAPVTVSLDNDPQVVELKKDIVGEQSIREDVLKAEREIQQMKQWSIARSAERDMLLAKAVSMEQDVEKHRQKLDQEKREDFDRNRAVSEAKFQLEQLIKAREQTEVSEAAPVVLESYATPISRVVEKYEVHFILWEGKIAYVPKDELEKEFISAAKSKIYSLRPDSPPITETLGPIAGFKIRYSMELHMVQGRPEVMYLWELRPVSSGMGETAEVALGPGSAFRGELSKLRKGVHTITIHVYGDSFDAFRKIRKELYQLGFAVAARPLAPDMAIGFSPEGTKSTAQ